MALTQQSLIGPITVRRNGIIEVRFDIQLFNNGVPMGDPKYHRTAFVPNADIAGSIDVQMAAVHAHMQQLGYEPVADSEIQEIRDVAALKWTPEVIAAYQAAQEQPA